MIMRSLTLILLMAIAGHAAASGWSLRVQRWQANTLEVAGEVARDIERRSERGSWHADHPFGRTGVVYEHQAIDLEAGSPATNGFMHQLDLTHGMQVGKTHVDLALGLHGSSNLFNGADFVTGGANLRGDAVVGRFRVTRPLEGWLDALGVSGDYRFGRFLVYPRLVKSFPMGESELVLDLPVSIAWRDAGGRWRLGLDRYGEHWATLDDGTETVEGKLYLDEWRLSGRYRIWDWGETRLDLGAGFSFDTEAQYLDLERGRVEGELDPALFAFVEIRG